MSKLRSMMLLISVLAAISVATTACSSEKPATETTRKTADKPATSTSLPADNTYPNDDTGAGSAVEISKLNACELVPGATVEKITGGKLQAQPSNAGPVCIYGIGASDKIESYKVMYMPAAPNIEYLKAANPDEKGEKVDGPWKEAWLGKASFGGFHVVAIFNDDIAIEVSGDRKEVLTEIAKTAAEGLKK